MLRPLLLVLALAGCAAVEPTPPVQVSSAARSNDPALMAAFFGEGQQRGVSPVIRCGIRCVAR
jgi:hypothetical protein